MAKTCENIKTTIPILSGYIFPEMAVDKEKGCGEWEDEWFIQDFHIVEIINNRNVEIIVNIAKRKEV